MLSGDPPPAPGDSRGHGEQLPGRAAQPHPESKHDILAAADINGVDDEAHGDVKSNSAAGSGLLSSLPASVARRLAQIEGHVGLPMDSATAGVANNQTQSDGTGKQRHETQVETQGCGVGGSVLSSDGSSGRQCNVAEVAARTARLPKLFLSVGHDEYWSGQQRGA